MRSLLLTCTFAACAFAQGSTGTSTITRDYSFPPVGLASTETAQVNVVNIATASTAAGATAPSCTGTITFTDAMGNIVGNSGKPTSFTTTGSVVSSTQLTSTELGVTSGRSEFVASVQLTTTLPSKAPCSLIFSLETFDATGVTHVYLGNSATSTPALSPTPIAFH